MEVSSYGGATETSGQVRILKDLSSSIEGEDVLIVEDIIDTGLTLNYLTEYLRGKDPASLRICTLLDKPARRLVDIDIAYRGFEIPDRFVIGYGLDYGEIYRNLPYIGVLRPEVYGGGVRRGLGRGRWLIAGGAVVTIASMPLAWLRVGGRRALGGDGQRLRGRRPARSSWPAWPCLPSSCCPTPRRDRRTASDRPIAYVACWLLAMGGMASVMARLLGTEGSSLTPGDAPGLWLAITGMAVVTWGLLELLAERPSPP